MFSSLMMMVFALLNALFVHLTIRELDTYRTSMLGPKVLPKPFQQDLFSQQPWLEAPLAAVEETDSGNCGKQCPCGSAAGKDSWMWLLSSPASSSSSSLSSSLPLSTFSPKLPQDFSFTALHNLGSSSIIINHSNHINNHINNHISNNNNNIKSNKDTSTVTVMEFTHDKEVERDNLDSGVIVPTPTTESIVPTNLAGAIAMAATNETRMAMTMAERSLSRKSEVEWSSSLLSESEPLSMSTSMEFHLNEQAPPLLHFAIHNLQPNTTSSRNHHDNHFDNNIKGRNGSDTTAYTIHQNETVADRVDRLLKKRQKARGLMEDKVGSSSSTSSSSPPRVLMIEGPKYAEFDFRRPKVPAPSASPVSKSIPTTTIEKKNHYLSDSKTFMIGRKPIYLTSDEDEEETEREKKNIMQSPQSTSTEVLSHTAKTASSVWDCSIVLGKYLEALYGHESQQQQQKEQQQIRRLGRVLELGSGQAIASISSAHLGAELVLATDLESALRGIQRVLELNGYGAGDAAVRRVRAVALDWTDPQPGIQELHRNCVEMAKEQKEVAPSGKGKDSTQRDDYILASDVVWVDFLVQPLVDTIARLMDLDQKNSGGNMAVLRDETDMTTWSTLLLAHQTRSVKTEQKLMEALDRFSNMGLRKKLIRLNERKGERDANTDDNDEDHVWLDPKFQRPNIQIWKFWRE